MCVGVCVCVCVCVGVCVCVCVFVGVCVCVCVCLIKVAPLLKFQSVEMAITNKVLNVSVAAVTVPPIPTATSSPANVTVSMIFFFCSGKKISYGFKRQP